MSDTSRTVPINVLVVDDEADVRWLFEQRFRKEVRTGKVAFHFAFSAEEALAYLHTGGGADIILVLSDINMPGMTGLELLRQVKQEFPALDVVMITAYGDEQTYQAAMAYGARDFITKPIDFDVLKQKIMNL